MSTDTTERFAYPLPVIQADTGHIAIETPGSYEGGFTLRNIGGGELKGRITSNSRCLSFSPEAFSGNCVEVVMHFHMDFYRKGDRIETSALIMSNGGEVLLPVSIHVTSPAVATEGGPPLVTLEDFKDYAKSHNLEARRLFSRKEFLMWLLSMNYEHMDMYEYFNKDSNKERALDNFLVFNGLKQKAELILLEDKIHMDIKPLEEEPLTGVIPFKLQGWGYLSAKLVVDGGDDMPWLKLMTTDLSAGDFDENGFCEASFIIYPHHVPKKYAFCKVVLTEAGDKSKSSASQRAVTISVSCRQPFAVALLRESYGPDDGGKLIVHNHTLRDLMLEVFARDSFLKFEGKRYLVSAYAEIPFSIKLGGLQGAQMALKKQPVLETQVSVRATIGHKRYEKRLRLTVGDLRLDV